MSTCSTTRAPISRSSGLECHTARAGRDKIDHPPGGHDDLANAVAGLVARAGGGVYDSSFSWVDGPVAPPPDPQQREARGTARLVRALEATGAVPDQW